jgi:hypothetical protein
VRAKECAPTPSPSVVFTFGFVVESSKELGGASLTKTISQVITNGLLSSKKEVKAGYGKNSGDDDNNTQYTSPHPSISVSVIRFKKRTFG